MLMTIFFSSAGSLNLESPRCDPVISVAVTDGLKDMAEALCIVYPATTLQTCIVHLICQ